MERFISNVISLNDSVYPINLRTASDFHIQETVKKWSLTFHQILFILDGKGRLNHNGKSYELVRGCAFFTAQGTSVEYIDEGGLISAFLTVTGPAADALAQKLSDEGFLFTRDADTKGYVRMIEQIIEKYLSGCDQSKLSALSYSFFVEFLSHKRNDTPDWLSKTVKHINLHFDEKLTLEQLARLSYISVSKLCHGFKAHYSMSVFEYIMSVRLQNARDLLYNFPDTMTKDIAERCGFSDAGYFCKSYRKKYGKSPSDEKMRN